MTEGRDFTVEFHPTVQLWVAYFCGCSECQKWFGKTKEEAVALIENEVDRDSYTTEER